MIPDHAPGAEPIPTVEMTGPEELVGPAGRIKVNANEVAQWEAQGYRRLGDQTGDQTDDQTGDQTGDE